MSDTDQLQARLQEVAPCSIEVEVSAELDDAGMNTHIICHHQQGDRGITLWLPFWPNDERALAFSTNYVAWQAPREIRKRRWDSKLDIPFRG